jgi:general secretion pathway protein C
VETLLRKYLWTIDLLVVALCAAFLGMAASGAVKSRLADIKTVARAAMIKPAKAATPATSTFDKMPKAILKRNVFCSACPPLLEEEKVVTPEVVVEPPPQPTTLPLAIMAIMYAPPPNGIRWSVVVLRDTEEKTMGAYSVGGKVRSAIVTEILETRVYLDNQGKAEYVDLFEAPPAPPAPAPVAVAPPPPPPVDPFTQELDRGIKKLSEHSYEIRRNTLESVLGNMGLLARSARIVPEMKDGKAAGFRLFAVRPEGPFAKIGMQNGDIISAINGLEITSPEKALEVYAKLKSASHLSLGMERNGQKITKEYKIR